MEPRKNEPDAATGGIRRRHNEEQSAPAVSRNRGGYGPKKINLSSKVLSGPSARDRSSAKRRKSEENAQISNAALKSISEASSSEEGNLPVSSGSFSREEEGTESSDGYLFDGDESSGIELSTMDEKTGKFTKRDRTLKKLETENERGNYEEEEEEEEEDSSDFSDDDESSIFEGPKVPKGGCSRVKRAILFLLRNPLSRIAAPLMVLALNMLIYNEDPMSYSNQESKVYGAGRVWNYYFRQYPPTSEPLWVCFKVFSALLWTVLGAFFGKYAVHDAILRDCMKFNIFKKDMGSWTVMTITSLFFVFGGTFAYNAVITKHFKILSGGGSAQDPFSSEAYVLNDNLGMKEYQLGMIAAFLCWIFDYLSLFVAVDAMLQDAHENEKRRKKYGCGGPMCLSFQEFWKSWRRTVFFVCTLLVTAGTLFYAGSQWEYGWLTEKKGHLFWNQYQRGLLCAFLVFLTLLMFVQDWDFPKFKKRPEEERVVGCGKTVYWVFPKYKLEIVFNGKWVNFGALLFLLLLDVNLFGNQAMYVPEDYLQVTDGNDRVRNDYGKTDPNNTLVNSKIFEAYNVIFGKTFEKWKKENLERFSNGDNNGTATGASSSNIVGGRSSSNSSEISPSSKKELNCSAFPLPPRVFCLSYVEGIFPAFSGDSKIDDGNKTADEDDSSDENVTRICCWNASAPMFVAGFTDGCPNYVYYPYYDYDCKNVSEAFDIVHYSHPSRFKLLLVAIPMFVWSVAAFSFSLYLLYVRISDHARKTDRKADSKKRRFLPSCAKFLSAFGACRCCPGFCTCAFKDEEEEEYDYVNSEGDVYRKEGETAQYV